MGGVIRVRMPSSSLEWCQYLQEASQQLPIRIQYGYDTIIKLVAGLVDQIKTGIEYDQDISDPLEWLVDLCERGGMIIYQIGEFTTDDLSQWLAYSAELAAEASERQQFGPTSRRSVVGQYQRHGDAGQQEWQEYLTNIVHPDGDLEQPVLYPPMSRGVRNKMFQLIEQLRTNAKVLAPITEALAEVHRLEQLYGPSIHAVNPASQEEWLEWATIALYEEDEREWQEYQRRQRMLEPVAAES